MHAIRAAAKQDPALNPDTMSDEKKNDLINSLLKYRTVQSHGVRVSNLAAAQDAAHTIRRIDEAVSVLQYF
jgi:hypothetical protein